jgi:glycosyltransferase involved in cell wall biosynthesis
MIEASKDKILFVEACNFVNAPQGGQLTAAQMLLKAFGSQLVLCGWTDDPNVPLGVWHKRVIDGTVFDFFAVACIRSNQPERPLLPARLTAWWHFKYYGKAILSSGINNVLTSEPSVMLALPFKIDHRVSYWFPGVGPLLSVSRYAWAKPFASLFDRYFYRKLRDHATVILAAADAEAICSLRQRAGGLLEHKDIHTFPTRVDTTVFFPCCDNQYRARCRISLKLPVKSYPLVVTSGRLHRAKGWPLLLMAFDEFLKRQPTAHLVFVGDGSDRIALEQEIFDKNLVKAVSVVGLKSQKELTTYLQVGDLFVMGSEKEGWSTSLVEAVACGLPIVTTQFSSANTLVCDGVNGFVVNRDPAEFSDAMGKALLLRDVYEYSRKAIEPYALNSLRRDMITALGL